MDGPQRANEPWPANMNAKIFAICTKEMSEENHVTRGDGDTNSSSDSPSLPSCSLARTRQVKRSSLLPVSAVDNSEANSAFLLDTIDFIC
jgi:hypothetical protein